MQALHFGTWLNLAEHLIWVQGVVGSNPVVPIYLCIYPIGKILQWLLGQDRMMTWV